MFVSDFNKPLILQSDFSLLLDVHNPLFDEARGRLSAFAELEKSPEHIHTYRMSPLSLWNAASAGLTSESILETLSLYSRFPVPPSVRTYIESTVSKFGKIVLIDGGEGKIEIQIEDERVRREILSQKTIIRLIAEENGKLFVPLLNRGFLKQALIDIGYPTEDKAPLVDGEPLELSLRTPTAASGKPFRIRDYQSGRRGQGVLPSKHTGNRLRRRCFALRIGKDRRRHRRFKRTAVRRADFNDQYIGCPPMERRTA